MNKDICFDTPADAVRTLFGLLAELSSTPQSDLAPVADRLAALDYDDMANVFATVESWIIRSKKERPFWFGDKMKMYVCCPDADCTAYAEARDFLTSYGIEPDDGKDETGHFIAFDPPVMHHSRQKAFYRQLAERTATLTTPPDHGNPS